MHLNGKWNILSLSLRFIPNQLRDIQWIAIKLTSNCRKANAGLFITETRTDTRCACNIVTAVSVPSLNTLRRFKQYWIERYTSEMLYDTNLIRIGYYSHPASNQNKSKTSVLVLDTLDATNVHFSHSLLSFCGCMAHTRTLSVSSENHSYSSIWNACQRLCICRSILAILL